LLPAKFRIIWQNGFRGEESKKISQSESSVVAMFANGSGRKSTLYRGPSIDASYQFSDLLAQRFQRRSFLKIDQSETRIACGGHVC
jgi:hypothetical protein